MIKKYNRDDYINLIGSAIEKTVGDECVIIFYGSILTNRFDRTSDIDVAVYCKKGLNPESYLKVLDAIEKLPILRGVDLVDLSKVKDAGLLENILKKGKIWKSSRDLLRDLDGRLKNLKKS